MMDFHLDIKTYAAILLAIRIVSMVFMGFVLKRQLDLFKLPIDKKIRNFRRVLFGLALLIFIGNIIPAGIDILTLTAGLARTTTSVGLVSLIYTLDASLTSLLSSYLIWRLYQLAHAADEEIEESDHTLMNEESHKPTDNPRT